MCSVHQRNGSGNLRGDALPLLDHPRIVKDLGADAGAFLRCHEGDPLGGGTLRRLADAIVRASERLEIK